MKITSGRCLKIVSIILGSWSKMVKHCCFYPNVGILWLMFFVFVGSTPSMSMAGSDEIKPMGGIAFIDAVLDNDLLLIDEFRYTITPSTRFYAQNGATSGRDRFTEGILVDFLADEHGNLLSLREEYDIEGEFKRNKPSTKVESNPSAKSDVSEKKRKKSTSLRRENGIWKN